MIFSISMKMISIRIMQLKLKMFTKSLENGNMSPKQVPCRNGFKKDEMNFFSWSKCVFFIVIRRVIIHNRIIIVDRTPAKNVFWNGWIVLTTSNSVS